MAESSSILSFLLKSPRTLRAPILVGSVFIKIDDLLDRCKSDQNHAAASAPRSSPNPIARSYGTTGTTLTLHDVHGRETGSLVVMLLDPATSRPGDGALAIDTDSVNVGPEWDAPPPASERVQGVVTDPGAVEDCGDSILNLLRRVVDKSKAVADSVEKTTEVCVSSLL